MEPDEELPDSKLEKSPQSSCFGLDDGGGFKGRATLEEGGGSRPPGARPIVTDFEDGQFTIQAKLPAYANKYPWLEWILAWVWCLSPPTFSVKQESNVH